jgi:hypothetical protein
MTIRKYLIMGVAAWVAVVSASALRAEQPETFFMVGGDIEGEVMQASAVLSFIRGKVPALSVVSDPAIKEELGGTWAVTLMFPEGFEPAPGSYTIAGKGAEDPETLKGLLVAGGGLFTHDAVGTVEFTEFGKTVKARFTFQAASRPEGNPRRQVVEINGEAVTDFADIFNEPAESE